MKILKFVLKNFVQIKTGMNAKEISIDFTNTENKLCLLIGPNGVGKTTILSLLQPFAGVGNLDVRNGNNLIMEGKDGYKEIQYQCGTDHYIIKHFYTPHKGKSHSVKSYIMKNGTELNENGNVTSFNEWVRIELGIEPDFLKLIRIGANVQTIIDMSTTERKNFMSKLLDEIGLFLLYYKKVNTDTNQIKEMITRTVDKLNSIGFEDKDSAKKLIRDMSDQLERFQEKYNKISGNISVYRHELSGIEDRETLKERLNVVLKKISKMDRILDKKDSLESTDPTYYKEKIDSCDKQLIQYNSEVNVSNLLIQNHLSTMNQLEEQKRLLTVQYQKESESDTELKNMTQEHRKMVEYCDHIAEILGDYQPEYTKKEIDDLIIYLKNTQQILNKTYEFGKKSIKKVMKLIRNNRNVTTYIDNQVLGMASVKTDESLFLQRLSQRFALNQEIPCEKNSSCEAMQLWIQVGNLIRTRTEEKSEKEDMEFYKDLELVYSNIKLVLTSFSEHKVVITKLPDDYKNDFKLETIYQKIENMEPIFDEKKYNDLLSIITEYNNYLISSDQAKILKKEIDHYSKLSNFTGISDQLEIVNEQIHDTKDSIVELKNHISELREKISDTNRNIETYQDLFETFSKYDELRTQSDKLQTEYELFLRDIQLIQSSEIELHKIKSDMERINEQIQKKRSDLSVYISLKKDLKIYNIAFDEMTTIKSSLSSKDGMALYYIKNYLGNSEDIVNELLDIAYDGTKYIDEFKITPTEFAIPWHNNGVGISDVKYASQGETSFISIALAFALATQSLKKYNIMLLDEPDGALDDDKRHKFIPVLENQIERVHGEQCFAITHNDMFSSYPVDIIDLGFNVDGGREKYQMAHFVDVKIT